MAYRDFHQCHPDLEDGPPIFLDTDGSPVYEMPYRILLQTIIEYNDITALHSYNNSPHSRVFLQSNEGTCDDPFSLAFDFRNSDALRALIEIYLSDTSLTEPLEEYTHRFGVSLIQKACATADREIVLWLLNHDPPLGSLTQRGPRGMTPLLCAAEALGDVNILMERPDAGETPVNARQRVREEHEHTEKFIYWLLDNGCSLSESSCFEGDWNRSLPEGSEAASQLRSTVLGMVMPSASYEMVCHLIAKGDDVHARMVWHGRYDSAKEMTPLHIAAQFWNLEGMQALIDHRGGIELADMVTTVDSKGRLPLHWALIGNFDRREEKDNGNDIISRMIATVKTLLDAKPTTVNSRDQSGATAFHHALQIRVEYREVFQVIQVLLDANPSVDTLNSRNHRGTTPLGDVIMSSKNYGGSLEEATSLIMILVGNGANPRLCASKGRNILHILCMQSTKELIAPVILGQLLKFVDVNETDDDGRTPLHYLVKTVEQIDAVQHLISRGADVVKSDHQGSTPLHELIEGQIVKKRHETRILRGRMMGRGYGNREKRARDELIQVLVNAGASMDTPNEAGQTPRQMLDDL
ncbi:Ankyrin repeat-containing domain [Penicillium camemberti]|uniref:Ankyrin repeat-containing domain n=1 Tax=Penicillium camemberti (strain FM 013) TaxID=1429867 RepID=A0A0G4PFW1_PENC3|nr:Ankyrin repeat-containing domain [Penicillium camemberti]